MMKVACETSRYNALPALDVAIRRLEKNKDAFERFTAMATEAIRKFNMPDGLLGAFLLHRHWELQQGMVMVERPRVLRSGRVGLVTKQQASKAARASEVSPSRWQYDAVAREFVPLEFSSDPFVGEVGTLFAGNDALRRTLGQLLVDHRLDAVIGCMVIPRKSIDWVNGTDFVETNDDEISVVRAERLSPLERAKSIMTGWPFSSTRRGSVFACCYCSHGPSHSCKHPLPDPPVCRPTGCV